MPDSSSKWAILIGIDKYHESLGSLKYAGADCRALRDTLVSGPLGFPDDQVLLLDDTADAEHRPTFANIHNTLGSWLAAPKEDDLVCVYFAGHGRLVDGKTYLVPGDATLSSIHTLGIPLRNVQDVLERCKAKRKLLVLDACHSGSGRDVAAMPGDMATALAAGTGFYTISSCGSEERSHEWDEVGHGVFSHFLAEALRGGCSPAADGRLTVDRLYEWVHDRVAKWAAQHRCAQTPQRFAQGAGTLVLAQSAPDYAALAEQYRREAEEAKARLAEAELRECRSRTNQNKSKKIQRQTKRCKVPEWKVWAGSNGPYSESWLIALIFIGVLGVLGSMVIGVSSHSGRIFIVSLFVLCGGPGVLLLALWLHCQERWQNKYRLHCADICHEAGDIAQGSSYAFKIGRVGVDAGTATAAVVSLAELSEETGDIETACILYNHAECYWKAPQAAHAQRRLRQEAGQT